MDSQIALDVKDCQLALEQLNESEIKLGEKHKLVNQFVNNAKRLPSATQIQILDDLQNPNNLFLRKIRLDLIIALSRMDLLLDVLKSEDKPLLNLLSQHRRLSWIFETDTSPFLDPTFLMNDFFPKVTYICRIKFIKLMSKYINDDLKCQQIFEAIQEKFGLKHALQLLPRCPELFISTCLEKYRFKKFPVKIIHLIAKKYPQMIFNYLTRDCKKRILSSNYDNSTGRNNVHYGSVLHILAYKDLTQYLDFYEVYHKEILGFQSGVHLSNRILKKHFERVWNSPLVYGKILDTNAIVKLPRHNLVKFLASLMPKNFADMEHSYSEEFSRWSKYLSPEYFNMAEKQLIFKEVLLIAYPDQDVVTTNLSKIFLDIASYFDPKERLLIAEYHLKSIDAATERISWIAIKPTTNSIPDLKQLLFHESEMCTRGSLLSCMVNSCIINNDTKSLVEVLRLVIDRYRNDHVDVLGKVLQEIDQVPNLHMLGPDIGIAMNELLMICFLNSDVSRIYWYIRPINQKLFIESVKRNLPLEDIVEKWIRINKSGYFSVDIFRKEGTNFEKIFLEELAKYYCKKHESMTSEEKKRFVLMVGQLFKDYNTPRHRQPCKRLSLNLFPIIADYLIELITDVNEDEWDRLFAIFFADPYFKNNSAIMGAFIKKFLNESILIYYLREDPSVILANIDTVMEFVFKNNKVNSLKQFLQKVKYHGYQAIYNKFVDHALIRIEDKNISIHELSPLVFFILSLYQSGDSYIQQIKKFSPEQSKINIAEENLEMGLKCKEFAVRSLVNIEQPSLCFDTLKSFCVGDYLKYSRDVLYSVCEHASIEKSVSVISNLMDSPVSLKKHVIRIHYTIMQDLSKKLSFLENLWTTQTNFSIRCVILNHLLDLYLYESSNETQLKSYNFLLNTVIPSLNFKDKAAIADLVERADQIIGSLSPHSQEVFVLTLCSKIFEPLDHIPQEEQLELAVKISLIQSIGLNYYQLSDDLLPILITKYFFATNEYGAEKEFVRLFARILLLKDEEPVIALLPFLMNTLEKVALHFESSVAQLATSADTTNDFSDKKKMDCFTLFFETLCFESLQENSNKPVCKTLLQKICDSSLFKKKLTSTFQETLWVQLAIIFHTCGHNTFDAGKGIRNLLITYLEEYGNEILLIFINNLDNFLSESNKDDLLTKMQLTQGLVNLTPSRAQGDSIIVISPQVKIVALHIFPTTCPSGTDITNYKQLSKVLLTSTSGIERIYINDWKKSCSAD